MGTDDLTVEECCVNIYRTTIKRLLDIILSACGILLLSPLFLILMLAVYIDDPGPVFLSPETGGYPSIDLLPLEIPVHEGLDPQGCTHAPAGKP